MIDPKDRLTIKRGDVGFSDFTEDSADLTRDEFIEWSLSLWKFAPEKKQKIFGHPAMFPEELPKRCIKMFSWKNALVYDPFCGAGTTCYVANKLGRNYIGSDIIEKYCEITKKRLQNIRRSIL